MVMVKVRPFCRIAALGRRLRRIGHIKGRTVLHRNSFHRNLAGNKIQGNIAEFIRHALLCRQVTEFLERKRFRLTCITYAVNAAQRFADKIVTALLGLGILKRAVQVGDGIAAFQPTGNRADILIAIRQHKAAAAGNGKAAARNAADIVITAQAALGCAAADDGLALPGNTSNIIRIVRFQIAKVIALQHRAHIHAANDATAAFFLDIDSPLIDAVPHHDASLVGHIQ